MANTMPLLEKVEPFIRAWLEKKFGTNFTRKRVPVGGGAFREFGAVSEDGSIVAAIRRLSGMTSGGNLPTSKIQLIFNDLHFLSLVRAKTKLLVITDKEFLAIVKGQTRGKVPSGIEIVHCPLPSHLEMIVKQVRKAATDEMSGGKTSPH